MVTATAVPEIKAGHQTAPNRSRVIRHVVVILVKATTYTPDGYPLRHRKGVLPSNSLAVVSTETRRALNIANSKGLIDPDIDHRVVVLDEALWGMRVDKPEKLVAGHLDDHTMVIVGLVGVQTNQFPRARDLARRFKAAGAEVVMGGFHVSGSIAEMKHGIKDRKRTDVPCPNQMPPEIQELMDEGIIMFYGEAEETWSQTLADIINGQPKMLYEASLPNLAETVPPQYPDHYFEHFAGKLITADTSRGCIFKCSFCTIINVQGTTMRFRDPDRLIAMIKREADHNGGEVAFFLTDDNFGRNPKWEYILLELIKLRKQGYRISFMIEADLKTYKLPAKATNERIAKELGKDIYNLEPEEKKVFLDLLAEAGCTQIFFGVESVNRETLIATGKDQNDPEKYAELTRRCHNVGIAAHGGYIIGFPADTPESISADIEELKGYGFDQISFFILTPLPGSEDHARMAAAGVPMDADFNDYDSFQPVTDHPNMTRAEWQAAYDKAWRQFYTWKHMLACLKRLPAKHRFRQLKVYAWYRDAALGQDKHPMQAGFWLAYNRDERRRGEFGQPIEGFWTFWVKQAVFRLLYFGHLVRELVVFGHIYYHLRTREVMGHRTKGFSAWIGRTFKLHLPYTRRFWIRYGRGWKWKVVNPLKWHWHLLVLPHAASEAWHFVHFLTVLRKIFGNPIYPVVKP